MSDQGRSRRHPRCQDLAVEPDLAGVVGRVQCSLIGAGRLAVAFGGDPQSALMLTLAARALGTITSRSSSTGPSARLRLTARMPRDSPANWAAMCSTRGSPKVERRRELADLPIDAVAYVEGVDAGVVGRAPVRPVGAYRVIYPFAEAGLSSRDIARVACAFGLVTDELAAVGSASSR